MPSTPRLSEAKVAEPGPDTRGRLIRERREGKGMESQACEVRVAPEGLGYVCVPNTGSSEVDLGPTP